MKTFSMIPNISEAKDNILCPLCSSKRHTACWTIGQSKFVRCNHCKLVYQNPQPVFKDLKQRYDEEYFNYEVENQDSFLSLMIKGLEDIGIDIEKGEGKSFLDIGCATGTLLEYAQHRDWKVQGVEICQQAVNYAREKRAVSVFHGTLDQWFSHIQTVDIFHSSHVIEHLVDPKSFIESAFQLLKPGGYFICTTPNIQGFQSKILGKKWRSVIDDHLCLFSKRQLSRLIKDAGFNIEDQKTWGGWAAGVKPYWMKKPMDWLAKKWGFGDVVIIKAVKPFN